MKAKLILRCSAAMLVAALACAAHAAADDGAAVTIELPSQPAAHWSLDQLKQQLHDQIKTVPYDSHGDHHSATCVPLLAVLQAAGVSPLIKMDPSADPKTKHRVLRQAVLLSATDGYAVGFSLAELLPDIGNHPVWLALDEDAKPLAGRDQPLRVLAPDDAKPARWIHGVNKITLIDLTPPPATAPSP